MPPNRSRTRDIKSLWPPRQASTPANTRATFPKGCLQTATLETALFYVPQVVCYYTAAGRFVSFLRKHLLHVPYISLVNLIAGREVVKELVADGMTVENIRRELGYIIEDGHKRNAMLDGYRHMVKILGDPGAADNAARQMTECLKRYDSDK